jgi:predicted nucleotide-binding protein
MKKEINKLEELKKQWQFFTYENFSHKGTYGHPSSLVPAWTAWTTRVGSIIHKLFGANSSQCKVLEQALNVRVIGNGNDKFSQCKSGLLGLIDSALDTIKDDVFEELQTNKAEGPNLSSNKVFVVHGHDNKSKSELEIFLSEIGLEPIVLHRQADAGMTIIEKFEKHSDVGYAFILLTPDEVSYLKKYHGSKDIDNHKENRARPNVIFEFGFFVGKLGRSRVCCLHTGEVSLPTDLSGIIYKPFNDNIEEVAYPIIKDLKAAGYKLKNI